MFSLSSSEGERAGERGPFLRCHQLRPSGLGLLILNSMAVGSPSPFQRGKRARIEGSVSAPPPIASQRFGSLNSMAMGGPSPPLEAVNP